MTRAVRTLLIAIIGVFVVQMMADGVWAGGFTNLFGLSIPGIRNLRLWQFVTYIFVHGSFFHLFLNCITLYFIGPSTEETIGTKQFYALFLLSGVLGGLGWLLLSNSPWSVCIGASGAIFGVLGAFAALHPQRLITVLVFFVLPVTLRAWVLVLVLALVELSFLLSGHGGNIAYAAHLAGGVAGYVYALGAFRNGGNASVLQTRVRGLFSFLGRRAVPGEEMDRLLDKISREGIHSLTRRERAVLDAESRRRRR